MRQKRLERPCRVLVLVSALLGAGAAGEAAAATRYVPGDHPSVQACVDAAASGDTCLVGPGVYVENVVVNEKTVTLQSTDGPLATILDGNCAGSVVTLVGNYPAEAVLDGFTVRNGCAADRGGGISITHVTTTIRNCIVTGNSAPAGGGIASHSSMVTIASSTISENAATDPLRGGGGIHSSWDLLVLEMDNTISGNGSAGAGGGILLEWAYLTDNRSRITGNTAGSSGGGISCAVECTVVGSASVVSGNGAALGGGIHVAGGAQVHVEFMNYTVTGNTAGEGGGFYSAAGAAEVIVLNGIVYGNSSVPVFQWANACSSVAYSDIEGGFAGPGNVTADPLFRNAAAGDYRLQPASPLVDAGTSSQVSPCASGSLIPVDLEGTPRPQGPTYDMGAYEYLPTITASAGPNGAISPSGDVRVTYGGSQTFTMVPAPLYRVADVVVDGASVGAPAAYTFDAVTTDHTVSVTFEEDTYVLSVSAAGAGTGTITSSPAGISCGAVCSAVYHGGTQVTLATDPDADSLLAGWSGACSGAGGCVVAMNANASVIATFDRYVTVTVPNGGESWDRGTYQTITWTYAGDPGPYVRIDLLEDGIRERTLTYRTPRGSDGSGAYVWRIPRSLDEGSAYRIRITSTSNGDRLDTSDGDFTLR